jgi:uncharacterized protein (TIGR02757 family)
MNRLIESLSERYSRPEYLNSDPICFPARFTNLRDIETTALISALFAYGNVTAMKSFLEGLFARLGPSPFLTLLNNGSLDPGDLHYRFQTQRDIGLFLEALASFIQRNAAQRRTGTIFENHISEDSGDLRVRIDSLSSALLDAVPPMKRSAGIVHLIGKPGTTSARKRYCMFLRWMTRTGFPDFGLYTTLNPADLIIPVDTHILSIAHLFGWTDRRGADWKTAVEITEHLKKLEPQDPLRFDFILTRPGILREKGLLRLFSGSKMLNTKTVSGEVDNP